MTHGDVGAGLVDREVHQDFAGALALAGDLLALAVDDAEVVGLEVALADAGRRAEEAVGADAVGVVALVAGAEALEPDAAADVAHLFLEFEFADAGEAVWFSVTSVRHMSRITGASPVS
jgi:hypothetical protein